MNADVLIVGATPGGIMAAIAAARGGASVTLLERTAHIGGLPANGLGATDIATRGATGGLFMEFVHRVRDHYHDHPDCSSGYHFEPSVAEQILEGMLAEHADKITVLRHRQLSGATKSGKRISSVSVNDGESFAGRVFVDATYEGDLAALAGAAFTTRREGQSEYHEPLAGKVYKAWGSAPHELGEGSTGAGDDTIQAFNYRLCLTDLAGNRVAIPCPPGYNRAEYASLVGDIRLHRVAGKYTREQEFDGIGRLVNIVRLPNGKTDSNNQHLAFLSTDLPEENYPWPTADWAWRDKFAARLRDYILGLLWFAQNDPELPAEFRQKCGQWGLVKDEYTDNANFPRQVYVREGRRIVGQYLFTAHDALPASPGRRPPIHRDSITASHYALDSHAHHKREPGKVHLDGFISHPTEPYTVPFGVMVPKGLDNLLTPVPVSGTHIGFSTLRMEPCWMALGHAAGIAAAMAARSGKPMRATNIAGLQGALLDQGAVLIYYRDLEPGHPRYRDIQFRGLRGELPGWEAL